MALTLKKPKENHCFWLRTLKNLRKISVFAFPRAPGPVGPMGPPWVPWVPKMFLLPKKKIFFLHKMIVMMILMII